ncbi:MAG: PAS domain S-box protein, partial [Methanoregulaceae archaeon]|nr:PAS domain S-box protein [Methanoregulaceae archaeon]
MEHPIILVVDDDPVMTMLARVSLGKEGFDVIECPSGAKALEALMEITPDAVILDVMMPEMDGFTTCRKIRAYPETERLPVVMATGLDDTESIHLAFEAGATDFFAKPLNWQLLGHRLRYILRASKTLDDLYRSESKNRALLDAIPDNMFRIGSDGSILESRGPIGDLRENCTAEQLVGRPVFDVLPTSVAQEVIQSVNKVLDTGTLDIFECAWPICCGIQEWEFRMVRSGTQEVLAILRDITRRKLAEDALYRSQQMLQLVLDHIPERVFWKNRNLLYEGCNLLFASNCELTDPSEIVGKNDFQLIWKDQAEVYQDLDRWVMENDAPMLGYEESLSKPDGSVEWVRTNKVPLHDRDGEVIGVLGTYEDITEHRQTAELLMRIVSGSPMAIFILQRGKVVMVNRQFEMLTGYTEEETIGGGTTDIVHPADREGVAEYGRKMLKGELASPYEYRVITKSGEIRTFMETVTPIQYRGERAVLGNLMDLTDRKILEIQLIQAQKLESIGQLAAGIAHEI